jgi:ApaG protein
MATSGVTTLLYRSILRSVRALTTHEPRLRVRQSVFDCHVQWHRQPHWRILAPVASGWEERVHSQAARIAERFPMLTSTGRLVDVEDGLTREQLVELIRAEFKAPADSAADDCAELVQLSAPDRELALSRRLDAMFVAYRRLEEQRALSRLSSSRTTNGVRIDATSGFLRKDYRSGSAPSALASPSTPAPPHCHHIFQYKITVTNVGSQTVQLLSRHLVFKNGDGSVEATVPRNSPGVVGQKPVLHPGQSFEYASGASLSAPTGEVYGCYQMVKIDQGAQKDGFDAIIGTFQCDAAAAAGAAPPGFML